MTTLQDFDMGAPPPPPDDDFGPEDLPTGEELLTSLDQIDIANSLLIQYQSAIMLRRHALGDREAPFNQRAQVLNAVNGILAQLVKLRTDLYNSERIRRLEGILLSCIKHLPEDARREFMEVYQRELEPTGG
jgi:hypothetical protein